MAVTHVTSLRNTLCDTVVDLLNSGKVAIMTSSGKVLARLTLNTTAFGAAATGQAIANPITSDNNATGGTAAKGSLRTSASATQVMFSVTATAGGGDVLISNTTIVSAQTVSLSSLRYRSAP